jgi:oligopeptide/dipeptide ABC transporter ATP-binding protein
MASPLLAVDDLTVSFSQAGRKRLAVDGVSLTIEQGEIVTIVGESGSGKTVTALAIARLLGEQGAIERGRIALDGRELTTLSEAEIRALRGRDMAMIFQDPMTSLNPLLPVGLQIAEALTEHLGLSRRQALAEAVALMAQVGIADSERQQGSYPHELSGGMRQRVMIAMAMACRPRLLIADEPTTALDVTVQAQILALLRELRTVSGTAILLITHDMGVVAEMADRVTVMYAGQIVEEAAVARLFAAPAHPYTSLLLQSIPPTGTKRQTLFTIAGAPPMPGAMPTGCRFHPRCPFATAQCRSLPPPLEVAADGGSVRCWRVGDPALAGGRG